MNLNGECNRGFFTKNLLLILCCEITIVCLCFLLMFIYMKDGSYVQSFIDTEMYEYDEGWILHDYFKGNTEYETSLSAIYYNLEPGTYKCVVDYEASQSPRIVVDSSSGTKMDSTYNSYIEANDVILNRHGNQGSFYITVPQEVASMTLSVQHIGWGDFTIHSLNLYKSKVGYIQLIVALLLLFIVLDIIIILWKKYPSKRRIVILIPLIALMSFLPYLSDGIVLNHDYMFHLMRIDGLAKELGKGQFPVYYQSLWLDGYGCPISIYYGDVLLYFPAFLRLVGFTVNTAYKKFVFLVCLGTAIIAYFSFYKFFRKENIAILCCLAYCIAPYRLLDIYVRMAVGEYCALMFLPLVFVAFYSICGFVENIKYDYLLLSFGMTGIVYCHLLSTIMTTIVLLIAMVLLIPRVINTTTVKKILASITLTLCMSSAYIVPFLESYLSNDIIIKYGNAYPVQGNGVRIGELFAFYKDLYGQANTSSVLTDRMYLSIGFVLTMTIITSAYLLFIKKGDKRQLHLTIMAAILLFVSTNLFPWTRLEKIRVIGSVMTSIQFPWRYLGYASLFGCFLLGLILDNIDQNFEEYFSETVIVVKKIILYAASILLLFELFIFNSNYSSVETKDYIYNLRELDISSKDTVEYLRNGTNISELTWNVYSDKYAEIVIVNREQISMTLHVDTYSDTCIVVPFLNYKGFKAIDDKGIEYEIIDGPNNEVSFMLPANYSGNITVAFKPYRRWKAALYLSWGSIIAIALLIIIKSKKGFRKENDIQEV